MRIRSRCRDRGADFPGRDDWTSPPPSRPAPAPAVHARGLRQAGGQRRSGVLGVRADRQRPAGALLRLLLLPPAMRRGRVRDRVAHVSGAAGGVVATADGGQLFERVMRRKKILATGAPEGDQAPCDLQGGSGAADTSVPGAAGAALEESVGGVGRGGGVLGTPTGAWLLPTGQAYDRAATCGKAHTARRCRPRRAPGGRATSDPACCCSGDARGARKTPARRAHRAAPSGRWAMLPVAAGAGACGQYVAPLRADCSAASAHHRRDRAGYRCDNNAIPPPRSSTGCSVASAAARDGHRSATAHRCRPLPRRRPSWCAPATTVERRASGGAAASRWPATSRCGESRARDAAARTACTASER
eukprot:ctg_1231.g303